MNYKNTHIIMGHLNFDQLMAILDYQPDITLFDNLIDDFRINSHSIRKCGTRVIKTTGELSRVSDLIIKNPDERKLFMSNSYWINHATHLLDLNDKYTMFWNLTTKDKTNFSGKELFNIQLSNSLYATQACIVETRLFYDTFLGTCNFNNFLKNLQIYYTTAENLVRTMQEYSSINADKIFNPEKTLILEETNNNKAAYKIFDISTSDYINNIVKKNEEDCLIARYEDILKNNKNMVEWDLSLNKLKKY